MINEVIIQKEPANCDNCLLNDYVEGLVFCRYYPNFKKIPFPLSQSPHSKPAFCKIKALIVHEEQPEIRKN